MFDASHEWRTNLFTNRKDMAKVCGLPSVVKVCTSMLGVKIGHRKVVGPLAVVNVVTQIGTSQVHIVHSLLL